MSRGSDELLQIEVGGDESLDVIKLDDGSHLLVVSERGPVQRRTVVKITQADSVRVAKFIVGIKDDVDGSEDD